MMKLDYVIIGSMKCGTSTLAAQLGAQKGIFMTSPKEPSYFAQDEVYAKGATWYAGLFANAAEGDLLGEASTDYTKLPTYPHVIDRLKKNGHRPKFIFMLRDPVERLVSHYIHEWTQGVISLPIDEAIIRHPELRAYSRYGEQLSPWVRAFDKRDFLILSMSELKTGPQDLLQKAGTFLGCDDVYWVDDLKQMNVSAERIKKLPLHGLVYENSVATWLRRRLVPQSLRDRIKSSRQMQIRPMLSPSVRAALVEEFRADRLVFLSLFSDRPDIDMVYPEPQ